MVHRIAAATFLITLLLAAISGNECIGQGFLQMGMDAVGWEANNATGPLLYREVPEAQLVSVRARSQRKRRGTGRKQV